MADYTIVLGDCLSSIAKRHGFADYRHIYDHPRNAAFRAKRPNPNVVFPGDVLFIPEKEERIESCATGQRHVFRTRVRATRLRIVLTDVNDSPRADVEYALVVGDMLVKSKTGADGLIEHSIPADAMTGEIVFPRTGITRHLLLGELHPADTISGAQGRLRNLGYDSGPVDGADTPRFRALVRHGRQAHHRPVVDGEGHRPRQGVCPGGLARTRDLRDVRKAGRSVF